MQYSPCVLFLSRARMATIRKMKPLIVIACEDRIIRRKLQLMILVLLVLGPEVRGLTVYDCNHADTTYEIIDLLEPEKCPDPVHDYEDPRAVTVQILQTDTSVPVSAYQCLLTISRKVTRCGFDSIEYGSQWTVYQDSLEITPSECRTAIDKGQIMIEGRPFRVRVGAPTTLRYYSYGGLDSAGNCKTASFMSANIWFSKSYELVVIAAEIKILRGVVDISTGLIRFSNGIQTKYQDEVLRDATEGTLVWTATPPSCAETVSEVYLGNATIHQRKGGIEAEAILMIENNKTSQYAGLILRQPRALCDVHCFSTQIRGIVACLMRTMDVPLPKTTFKTYFDPKIADIQTQLSHLHLGTNMRMYERFEAVHAEICELDRRTLHLKLQAIAGVSNPYSLLDLFGPGHVVYTAGATAYVSKCIPVQAVRVDYHNCTEEVPVSVNGTKYFADPFTWVLREYPTVVPCSYIMPVRWRINRTWYCSYPSVSLCVEPMKLNVSLGIDHVMPDFTRGLGSGVFTPRQLEEHRLYQITQSSRRPVLAKVTNAAVGAGLGDGVLGIPFDFHDINHLTLAITFHAFPFFYHLGQAWNYFCGFMMALVFIKLVVGCTLRAWVLYREKGLGVWMFASLWNTAYVLLKTPGEIVRKTTQAITDAMDPTPEVLTYQDLRRRIVDLEFELRKMGDPRVAPTVTAPLLQSL